MKKDKDGNLLKVGFTASAFDLLHAGHIAMLEEAKNQCDYLIVGLHANPQLERSEKNRPVESIFERTLRLRATRFVDEVIVYETENELLSLLTMLNIDVRIIGQEYKMIEFTGKKLCKNLGIEIYYNRRQHKISSSGLRERITA